MLLINTCESGRGTERSTRRANALHLLLHKNATCLPETGCIFVCAARFSAVHDRRLGSPRIQGGVNRYIIGRRAVLVFNTAVFAGGCTLPLDATVRLRLRVESV
jgi:hypothetical protein